MKVAIIFIGTNKYLNFLPTYYQGIMDKFLPNSQKIICTFTDGHLDAHAPREIKVYKQEHLAWPNITLKRFEIIKKARNFIETCDWLVFLDADTRVVTPITEEELFTDNPYFGVHHPCHAMKMWPHFREDIDPQHPGAYEYTDQPANGIRSRASVTREEMPEIYIQGCLWGGKVPQVLDMIDELDSRVEEDLANDLIAVWHDESHLNKFYSENINDFHILGPEYAYPEVFDSEMTHYNCNWEKKIVHLKKDNSAYQI